MQLKRLAFIYQVYIFQDHVMRFCVFAEAKQAHNVGVIQFTEHVDLPPELSLRELVPAQKTLHQNHSLFFTFLNPPCFGQEHLTKLPFAWMHTHTRTHKIRHKGDSDDYIIHKADD